MDKERLLRIFRHKKQGGEKQTMQWDMRDIALGIRMLRSEREHLSPELEHSLLQIARQALPDKDLINGKLEFTSSYSPVGDPISRRVCTLFLAREDFAPRLYAVMATEEGAAELTVDDSPAGLFYDYGTREMIVLDWTRDCETGEIIVSSHDIESDEGNYVMGELQKANLAAGYYSVQ